MSTDPQIWIDALGTLAVYSYLYKEIQRIELPVIYACGAIHIFHSVKLS